ncbi:hypothetical protein Dvar_14350 [Desulfosarcina variabilis str. Montpellier]|uniref:DUF6599 family protein n=1 Tax=Desulfosarcina variabilis TaxID=2300 RepID=UPI003AFAFB66
MKTAFQKQPGPLETRISMIILAVLVVVAGWVFLRQYHTHPAVIALRPESQIAATSANTTPAAVVDTTGSDLIPFSPPEHFGPDTLYEKINGRADLYLSSGFISLNAQRFTLQSAAGNWIEVFAYDMGTPENAFSVYSMQRRDAATSDRSLPDAYRTENALFMVHGQFYLELIGTNADDMLNEAMGTLARRFAESHAGASKAKAPGQDLFPTQDLDTTTRQLITANAFGYEMLDHIYTAQYLIDGTRLTVFVSDRQTPEAASALADNFSQTLVTFGATAVDIKPPVANASVLQFFDTYEIIFSHGPYVAGVHEAVDLNQAGMMAKRLAEHLKQ